MLKIENKIYTVKNVLLIFVKWLIFYKWNVKWLFYFTQKA
jgi:hypothetical protein